MKHLRLSMFSTICGCLILTIACSAPPPSDLQAAEAAIRQADTASLKAIAAKQVDSTLSFYDEGASLLAPNAPIASGKEAIRKAWEQMFGIPGFTLAPKITRVDVARSGDLAYVLGTYEATVNDARGEPATDHGKFVVVWKKQADGAWKIAADIWNSDLPPPPAPK